MAQPPCRARLRRRLDGGRVQRGGHPDRAGCRPWRLMRHFLTPRGVSTLAGSVSKPPGPRRLISPACFTHRTPARHFPARWTAIALSPVAPAAEEENLPALRSAAGDEAQRVHRTPRAPLSGAAPRAAVLPRSSRAPSPHTTARRARRAFQLRTGGPFVCRLARSDPTAAQQAHKFSVSPDPSKDQARMPCSIWTVVPPRQPRRPDRSTSDHDHRPRFMRITTTAHTAELIAPANVPVASGKSSGWSACAVHT